MKSPSKTALWALLALHAVGAGAGAVATAAGPEMPEPGVMLRSGTWDGGVGTYAVPEPFLAMKPPTWPGNGWQKVDMLADKAIISDVQAPGRERPKFLEEIATQVAAGSAENLVGPPVEVPEPESEYRDIFFARLPGARLRSGEISVYLFKNGTRNLSPKLDYRYELSLGEQRFAFTVQNGFKGPNGATYGDGAQYTIEVDSVVYEYSLQEYGWDSRIAAIADFDGDGKPDFLITVSGSNSSHEYLLLSSLARPGKNPPSASLHATGC